MNPHSPKQPRAFISATSQDLRSARELVAKILLSFECLPVWQDIFGTEGGDLRAMLREKIDPCQLVVQLVGHRYGAEPPTVDPAFGRVSYTQYEARYAVQQGKKVIYLILDDTFPTDGGTPEPEERRSLQLAYRNSLHTGEDVFHDIVDSTVLAHKAHGLAPQIAKLQTYLNTHPWSVPPRAARFTGRADQLIEVADLLAAHQRVALIGPGGMGKTALAAEVIHRLAPAPKPDSRWPGGIYQHDYYKQSGHAAALTGLLAQAGIREEPGMNLEAEVRRLFSQPGVLLYLEGCEKAEELVPLLDLTGPAQVLLTTRDHEKRGDAYVHEVYPLPPEDAAQLLHYCARQAELPAEPPARQPWLKLAGELGGHPLALRLAGARMLPRREEPADFAASQQVQRFGDWAQRKERRENLHHLFASSAKAVAAENPLALELWFALSLHAHALVPLPVLCACVGKQKSSRLQRLLFFLPRPPTVPADAAEVQSALAVLVRLSLAEPGKFPAETIGQTEPAWQLSHALLGEWGREELSRRRRDESFTSSPDAKAQTPDTIRDCSFRLPPERSNEIFRTWRTWWVKDLNRQFNHLAVLGGALRYSALHPHWEGLLRRIAQHDSPEACESSREQTLVASIHRMHGNFSLSQSLQERALAARWRTLGPEHPDTLESLNHLAILLADQEDLAGAEPLFRRALEARERTLGKTHRQTLSSLNNLAVLLQNQGDLAGAEPLHRRALAASECTLGPDHPDTLASLNNLANLLKNKGDLAEAEPLYHRALATYERTLGPEHPDALRSMSNLAGLLEDKRDVAGAERMYRLVLELSERSLGPEHPHSLKRMNDLACLLEKEGDLARALSILDKAVQGARNKLLKRSHARQLYERNLARVRAQLAAQPPVPPPAPPPQ